MILTAIGDTCHEIHMVPPFFVCSRAFLTRLPMASLVQDMSQISVSSGEPSVTISFPSFLARSAKSSKDFITNSSSLHLCFSNRIFPVSRRVIFNIDWISCSIRLMEVSDFALNSCITSGCPGSFSMISRYIESAARGVFNWWEISEMVFRRKILA